MSALTISEGRHSARTVSGTFHSARKYMRH
nr:MAG TPA: hypothetical protein [Caudoviricetes sp.]